jgi:hypothetical protein
MESAGSLHCSALLWGGEVLLQYVVPLQSLCFLLVMP